MVLLVALLLVPRQFVVEFFMQLLLLLLIQTSRELPLGSADRKLLILVELGYIGGNRLVLIALSF